MHEILSLALVVLGYASPLDYSHLNLCITWDRPSVQKKKVFPSANKMFSYLSVDIWVCSHCSGVAYSFFAGCPVQSHRSANAGSFHTRAACGAAGAQQADRGGRSPVAPPPRHQKVNAALMAGKRTNPSPIAQCRVNPPVSASSFRSPRSVSVSTTGNQHSQPLRFLSAVAALPKEPWCHRLCSRQTPPPPFLTPGKGFVACLCSWREIFWQQLGTIKSSLLSALCAFPWNSGSWGRNRFHPPWHSVSNLAACSSLTCFNNRHSHSWTWVL